MTEANIIEEGDIPSLTLPDFGKKKSSRKNKHYVDNVRLSAELTEWKERYNIAKAAGLETPRLPEFVGKSILDIAENLGKSPNFSRYSFLEEMKGEGIESVLTYIGNYDPTIQTKSGNQNAFSYITRIIYFSFTHVIEQEARQAYYKLKSFELMGGSAMLEGEDSADMFDSSNGPVDKNEIVNDMMSRMYKYEEKQRKRLEADKERQNKPAKAGTLEQFYSQELADIEGEFVVDNGVLNEQ